MRRRLADVLALLSLLLFLTAMALWVRGYSVADEFRWVNWPYTYALRSCLGGVQAVRARDGLFTTSGYSATPVEVWDFDGDGIADIPPRWTDRYPEPHAAWQCCGFAAFSGRQPVFILRSGPAPPDEARFSVFVLPCWFLAATAALLPAARLSGWIRGARRRRRGLCTACGYDLTANVTGVCPECGSAFTFAASFREPQRTA